MPAPLDPRRDAVAFLVALVSGGPAERLLAEWRRLGSEGLRPVVMEEAARLQVRSALGTFCSGLPAEELDETAEVAAAALALGRARADAAVTLALELCASPHVAGRRAVVVKGAGLILAGRYSGEREVGDADLVVAPEDLEVWRSASDSVGARWRPMVEGNYEVAEIRRGSTIVELHVSLPGDGGHVAGPAFGALWPRSEPVAVATSAEVRTPLPGPAREIAAHHAVIHHRGDPEYVLRALQDVARLATDGAPEGERLFRREDVDAAVAFFERLATSQACSDPRNESVRAEFVTGLLRAGVHSDEERFARGVETWIDASRRGGRSGLALALRRTFARESGGRRLAARLSGLVRRYVVGRFGAGARRRRREEERWVSFLSGGRTPPPAS